MKKVLFSMLFIAISISTFGQVSLEATAGMNVATVDASLYGSRIGFHAGLRGEYPINANVYANGAVLLSLKGASIDIGDLGNARADAYYLDIPIHIGYKHPINETISLFGEAGPYFAFGLFGKTNATALSDFDYDDRYIYEKDSHDTFDELKRFDFGLGFRVGAEINAKYTISVGYDLGLINVLNLDYDYHEEDIYLINNIKNRNFYISLGYKF